MSRLRDQIRALKKEAARYHATFTPKVRSCGVTPLGKIRDLSDLHHCRHVPIGAYTNAIPLDVFAADVLEAWGEMRDGKSV